jgi:hypothetical protein
MLYKNLPPATWQRIFPQRVLLDLAAGLRAMAAGRPHEVLAIYRAYRDAHRLHRHYQDMRPASHDETVLPSYRGSIVVDYFVRGRRRFQDLPASRFRSPYDS